ncbi:holo-ACP synthase [Mucilaginibacter ginsenosidivorans]|uniref:Holo-[acyl-carrier-protein] synthase n=1 Tax=Mucilaginibacter ginsenosidivorans TaxID=398053 RepID=A0A5B8UTD8_9SPHI|nr:holo-ACP synthase [Mucilaginibacter ginsenosidivorans]QEC62213.1 holo-[acyl-carrier-protein] synthase [Mucilaginibacter ginsenosidivorans]
MIFGVGIDMVEVERIATSISREAGFRELVFSGSEIIYCESKKCRFEHYAARFAAKEAFFKALGTGWADGTAFSEVEVTNAEDGKPEIKLLRQTLETVSKMGVLKFSVSLTHTRTMASAIVIIEK